MIDGDWLGLPRGDLAWEGDRPTGRLRPVADVVKADVAADGRQRLHLETVEGPPLVVTGYRLPLSRHGLPVQLCRHCGAAFPRGRVSCTLCWQPV